MKTCWRKTYVRQNTTVFSLLYELFKMVFLIILISPVSADHAPVPRKIRQKILVNDDYSAYHMVYHHMVYHQIVTIEISKET